MQPRTQSTLPIEEEEAYGNEDTKQYGLNLGCTVNIYMECWMDYKNVKLNLKSCVCVICFGLQTMFSNDETKLVSCLHPTN